MKTAKKKPETLKLSTQEIQEKLEGMRLLIQQAIELDNKRKV